MRARGKRGAAFAVAAWALALSFGVLAFAGGSVIGTDAGEATSGDTSLMRLAIERDFEEKPSDLPAGQFRAGERVTVRGRLTTAVAAAPITDPAVNRVGVPRRPVVISVDGVAANVALETDNEGEFAAPLVLSRAPSHIVEASVVLPASPEPITSNKLVFRLAAFPLDLSILPAGRGAIELDGDAVGSCSQRCSKVLGDGGVVRLTALPVAGARFRSWSGSCSGTTPTCAVTVTGARSAVATFDAVTPPDPTLVVQVTNAVGGAIRSSDGRSCSSTCRWTVPRGQTVYLSAISESTSTFDGWTADCSRTPTVCTLVMDQDRSVAGAFSAKPGYRQLVVELAGQHQGSSVVSNPPGIKCGTICTATYPVRSRVALTAQSTAAEVKWPSTCSVDGGVCAVELDEDKVLRVGFVGPPSTTTTSTTIAGGCVRLCGVPTATVLGETLSGGAAGRSPAKSLAHRLPQAGIVMVLLALIGFPAVLIDKSLEDPENANDVRRWLRKPVERFGPLVERARALPKSISLLAFLCVAGALTALGSGDGAALAALLGYPVAILGACCAFELPRGIQAARLGLARRMDTLGLALALAAVCALASWRMQLEPAYVYGIVIGFSIARGTKRQNGHVGLWSFAGGAAGVVLALATWTLVARPSQGAAAGLPVQILGYASSGMLVACVEALFFVALPLRFVDGRAVYRWSRSAWAAVQATGLLAFVWFLAASPTGDARFKLASRNSVETTLVSASFIAFGLASLVVWGYFRFHAIQTGRDDDWTTGSKPVVTLAVDA